jgi:ribonuclease HI
MVLCEHLDVQAIIYSDGACSGNPGPGGWGAIVYLGGVVSELGGGEEVTTNNRMEMLGVLESLRFCLLSKTKSSELRQIQIYTDSVYVIKGATMWMHGWKRRGWKNAENEEVANRDIWVRYDEVLAACKAKGISIEWNFVKGHTGVAGNERCDVIAVAYSKGQWVDLYEGSAETYIFDILEKPATRPLPEYNKQKTAGEKKAAWYISYVNGVFKKHQTWSECEALVKGRAAQFKKVTSQSEEDEMKKKWGIS